MFCIDRRGSVLPLRVNPKRFYETARKADKYDIIYWMCVLLQTTIETWMGLIVRLLRYPFWFLGCCFFMLDTVLARSFVDTRFNCMMFYAADKWSRRIQNSYYAFHKRLDKQSALSSVTVGALLDVLQLRLSCVPVLASRCLLLLAADVEALFFAAKFSVQSTLESLLINVEEGYMYTYTQLKREFAFSNLPCPCDMYVRTPEERVEQPDDDLRRNPERQPNQPEAAVGKDESRPEPGKKPEQPGVAVCKDDSQQNAEREMEQPGVAVCPAVSQQNPEKESEQPEVAVSPGDSQQNPEKESEQPEVAVCPCDPQQNREIESEEPGTSVCNGDSHQNPEAESEQPGVAVSNGDSQRDPESESEFQEKTVNGSTAQSD